MAIEWVWPNEQRVSVLDCAGPPALLEHKSGDEKRQRAAAVQDLAEYPNAIQKHGNGFIYRTLTFAP
jgi:hypothetical protein